MIELTNTNAQVLEPGQALIFDTTVFKRNYCECHRRNSSSVKMTHRGDYRLAFFANVSGATADVQVQLIMTVGGEELPETLMITTPSVANTLSRVAAMTFVHNGCCDYDRVAIVNNGDDDITVPAGAVLIVEEV